MRWLLLGKVNSSFTSSLCKWRLRFSFEQKRGLVNVKLKWVKDKELDAVIVRERHVKAVSTLVSVIFASPDYKLPIYHLLPHRGQLGLPFDLKLTAFLRRFPNVFVEHWTRDSAGTRVPCFSLTNDAIDIHRREAKVNKKDDVVDRLCKLLMLTTERTLPLHSIDHLRWDLGLPYDYRGTLVRTNPELFTFVKLSSELVGLKLMRWDERLAVSHLEIRDKDCTAFPVKFTRGFGLKRKSMEWLQEWQRLPYTSPYVNASHLDPRTDLSEKRNVGVFHEVLHLTVGKKMERKNVSNLRKPFALPQKFTKVFERHPGIFYISMKCDTQTVILREAYDRRCLVEKHPLVEIREEFGEMMNEGFLDRSRGLYQKSIEDDDFGGNSRKIVYPVWSEEEEEEPDSNLICGYGSDYPIVEEHKQ